jgi:hypothetical protein
VSTTGAEAGEDGVTGNAVVAAVEAGDPGVGEAGAGEDAAVAEEATEFPAAAAVESEPAGEGAGGVAAWYRAGGRKVRRGREGAISRGPSSKGVGAEGVDDESASVSLKGKCVSSK